MLEMFYNLLGTEEFTIFKKKDDGNLARERGRLTSDLHLSLISCKYNAPVSSLKGHLLRTPLSSCTYVQWITQNFPSIIFSSQSLHWPKHNSSRHSMGTHRTCDQENKSQLQIFISSSTPPNVIPKSHPQICSRPPAVASHYTLKPLSGD